MLKFFRFSCCLATFFLNSALQLEAQSFSATLQSYKSINLSSQFTSYQVFQLDAQLLDTYVKTNSKTLAELKIGGHHWHLELTPNPIFSDNYSIQVSTPQGIITSYPKTNIAYKGKELKGGGRVRLSLNDKFLYGFVEEGTERFYIEPLWYFEPLASHDLFVLYSQSSVMPLPAGACGLVEEINELQNLKEASEKGTQSTENSGCYELDLAIASDRSIYDKYGSVSAVENHNVGVINDVQVDYYGSFNHDLEFVIVTQFVVTGSDPWTNSTDPVVLLGSFRDWGNNNGFGVNFDNGELWTNRSFSNGAVGVAYLNGICNSSNYHCLRDYTANAEWLRCMTSHEFGHNFSSVHDANCPPDFIMCPYVSLANSWSQQSSDGINAYMQSKINSGCLTPCGPHPPLIAGFDWLPNPTCQNETVNFTDLSSGNIIKWAWTFEGGSPASSNVQNPTVTWNSSGPKNVTLTITGQGGVNSLTKTIDIQPLSIANFTHVVNVRMVTFTNTSAFATTYEWDFGDGYNSTEVNPVHEYVDIGNYTVVLTATNACGVSTKTILVVTAPVANFVASPRSGCSGMVAVMENLSSYNATTFLWSFPGGAPSSSNQPNPTVLYNIAGTFPITLKAANISGSDIFTQTDYITVKATPTAKFTTSINGSTVTFNNTSIGNADAYLWNFGDGSTSTQTNPIHIYAVSGTYDVVLTASNVCGSSTKTQSVTVVSTMPPTAAFTANPLVGCVPLTVNFTNNTTGAVSNLWTFPGGTPDSSTLTNPTVVYNIPGIYTATLIAGNQNGSDTASTTITTHSVPVAGFTYAISKDTTVSFNNTSMGATSYLWTFGDGDSSMVANPEHDYPVNDSIYGYQVIMRAINDCGMVSDTQIIAIITDPKANFTATTTSGCAPLSVQFSNRSSSNATTFKWLLPGGVPDTSIVKNPVVNYATPGSYTVTLIAINSAGRDTFSRTNFIVVNTTPSPGFNHTANGLTVTFTNNTSNGISYTWDFGDGGSSSDVNPTHDYAVDGTYMVVLTATNDCGTSTFTQNVVITTAPDAGFSVNTTSGCAVLSVNFADISSGNPVSWAWTFPGGTPSSSSDQNPTVQYFVPGVYDVTLVVTSMGGSTSSFTQPGIITVNGAPGAGFTSSTNGSTVNFANTSSNASSYIWNFGDGSNSTDENPGHTYLNDGVYTVTLLASNNCGTTILEQTVVVSTPPTAAFTTSGSSGCTPFTVQFTNASSSNASAYLWEFAGGAPSSSTEADPSVVWNSAGVYTVTLTAFNAAGSSSSTTTIEVDTAPTAGFTYQISGLTVIFNNISLNGTSYSWNFGDGYTSTEQNPTHTFEHPDTYHVFLIVSNSCGTTVIEQVIQLTSTETAEVSWIEGFRLFPNPNSGSFTIEMNGSPQEEVEFVLCNLLGQRIQRETLGFGTGSLVRNFDYRDMAAGVYILRIQVAGQVMFVRITINR